MWRGYTETVTGTDRIGNLATMLTLLVPLYIAEALAASLHNKRATSFALTSWTKYTEHVLGKNELMMVSFFFW